MDKYDMGLCWNVVEAPEQNLSQCHSHHHKTHMDLSAGETGLLDLMPGQFMWDLIIVVNPLAPELFFFLILAHLYIKCE